MKKTRKQGHGFAEENLAICMQPRTVSVPTEKGKTMTEFNTQTGGGEYRLQFETDNKEYFLLMQEIARRCVDGKPASFAVGIVRCKDCKHWSEGTGWCDQHSCFDEDEWNMFNADDFCSYGERKRR